MNITTTIDNIDIQVREQKEKEKRKLKIGKAIKKQMTK